MPSGVYMVAQTSALPGAVHWQLQLVLLGTLQLVAGAGVPRPAAAASRSASAAALQLSERTFGLGGPNNNSFVKDGQPFRFMAGSMHYWRNKPSEWKPKLQLMRDLGLNAVLTPTNWGWHEPQEGQWDFAGGKDLVNFVQTAHEVGLLVLLRLGSYATAEMVSRPGLAAV